MYARFCNYSILKQQIVQTSIYSKRMFHRSILTLAGLDRNPVYVADVEPASALKRGEQVVIDSGRGPEIAEVVCSSTKVNQSLAKLVRPASVEDIVLNAHLEEIADKALNRCTAWLESQHNAAVLTAIEPLLDCKTVYFHFLGVDCGEWELSQLLRYYEMELGEDDFVKRVMTGCGPNCGSGGCGSAQTGCVGCALKNRAVTRSKVLH